MATRAELDAAADVAKGEMDNARRLELLALDLADYAIAQVPLATAAEDSIAEGFWLRVAQNAEDNSRRMAGRGGKAYKFAEYLNSRRGSDDEPGGLQ